MGIVAKLETAVAIDAIDLLIFAREAFEFFPSGLQFLVFGAVADGREVDEVLTTGAIGSSIVDEINTGSGGLRKSPPPIALVSSAAL